MATAEIGCHSATISPTVLSQLAETQYNNSTPLRGKWRAKPNPNQPSEFTGSIAERLQGLTTIDPLSIDGYNEKNSRMDINYLANNGAELDRAISGDPTVQKRLDDALSVFRDVEARSKSRIEKVAQSASF